MRRSNHWATETWLPVIKRLRVRSPSGAQKSFSEYRARRSFIYLNISKLLRFSNIKLQLLNSYHPTIKFEISYSNNKINFFDTIIYLDDDHYLKSGLYIKPTDCLPLLHFKSYHPESCKSGLVCSEMLRYRRIITEYQISSKRAQRLRVILFGRSYRDADILLAMRRAYSFTHSQLLVPKTDVDSPVLPFVTPLDHNFPHLSSLLRQHWSHMENDRCLSLIFQSSPVVSFQRNPNF